MSSAAAFLVAATFHDLGIWTAHTFDYLEPSIALACQWLTSADQEEMAPLVSDMISQHHKIRRVRGPHHEVELLRRADTADASMGMRRFGIAWRDFRDTVHKYPNAGFHRRLVQLSAARVHTNPLSPLPMIKW